MHKGGGGEEKGGKKERSNETENLKEQVENMEEKKRKAARCVDAEAWRKRKVGARGENRRSALCDK